MSQIAENGPTSIPIPEGDVAAAYQAGLAAIPVPILTTDSGGRIVYASASLEQLFEYPPGELIGAPVECLLPPKDRTAHPELRDAYFQLPQARAMAADRDLRGVSKTGRLIPVEVYLKSFETGGEVFALAAVIDVSRTADRLDRSRQALDAASSGMVMVDADGVIVLVNAKVSEMFGYERDALIGSRIEMLIPEQLRRRHEVYRRSYGADPTERTMDTGRDLNGRRSDGSEFPLEIGLMPIEGIGERLVMATVIDMSERRQSELAIEQRNGELMALNAELEQVAHSASHDLKAPLTTIDGLLSCVVEDLEHGDFESVGLNIERTQLLTRRLARLIEGILGLAGSGEVDCQWTDLSLLIDQAVASLEAGFDDHDVEVSVAVPPTVVKIEPTRVAQIVQNLLGNAAKFIDPGKAEHRVSVVVEQHPTDIVILVTDNGIGIPEGPEHHAFSIFGRFDNHNEPGNGLGLSLVKRNVDFLGGSVTYTSSSEGTTFRVVLPVVYGDSDDLITPPAEASAS